MNGGKFKGHPVWGGRFIRIGAFAIVMLFLMTALSSAAQANEIMKSEDLRNISPEFVKKYDLITMIEKAAKQETISFDYLGPNGISFQLIPSNIISPDCMIVKDGVSSRYVDTNHAICYAGTALIGAKVVTATFASKWMHFQIELLDGKLYSIDPYDGTGASGLYAVYAPDDNAKANEISVGSLGAASQPYPDPGISIDYTSNTTDMQPQTEAGLLPDSESMLNSAPDSQVVVDPSAVTQMSTQRGC